MDPQHALRLRLAQPHEASGLARMSRDLIEHGLGWRYTPERIAALIGARETNVLVACEQHRIRGFAVMQFGDERAHLALLCVAPESQRRGIARRLVEWLVESARVAGIEQVGLELRTDNAAALALYQRLGFVECARLADYYGPAVDARRMLRRLRCAPGPGDAG